MRNYMKQVIENILRHFGKRITNYHAPAKPYAQGIRFLQETIKKPTWIIDVGFADGTPDITNVFPMHSTHYLLIDPAPKFKPYLDSLAKQYPDTVRTETCMCGEENATTPLHINRTGHYSSRYVAGGCQETIDVPMVTLDSLAEKHKLTGPILLKIDVEGAEIDVLRGSEKTLALCDVVILETWINSKRTTPERDFASIVTFMKAQGLVIFDLFGGHTNKSGTLRQLDAVFVHENSPYRTV